MVVKNKIEKHELKELKRRKVTYYDMTLLIMCQSNKVLTIRATYGSEILFQFFKLFHINFIKISNMPTLDHNYVSSFIHLF